MVSFVTDRTVSANAFYLVTATIVATVTSSLGALAVAASRPNRRGFGHALSGVIVSSVALFVCMVTAIGLLEAKHQIPAMKRRQQQLEATRHAQRYAEPPVSREVTSGKTRVNADLEIPTAVSLPEPIVTDRPILGTPLKIGPLHFQELVFPDAADTKFGDVLFSPDGRWLFVRFRGGALRKIRTSDMREERLLDTSGLSRNSRMTFSSEGLLATSKSPPNIWVVDPETLQVKRGMGRKHHGSGAVASCSRSPLAFFAGRSSLRMVDVRRAKRLHYVSRVVLPETDIRYFYGRQREAFPFIFRFKEVRVSPDGNRIFLAGGPIAANGITSSPMSVDTRSSFLLPPSSFLLPPFVK